MAWAGDDVSVVIQGPVHGAPNDPPERQLTREAIASARRAWPGCQVIVSTWSNADVSNLQPDRMVLNLDPGAVPLNDSPNNRLFNNLNRQIVSTRAGLAVAERSWAIKLRSDCALECPADFASLVLPVGASPWKLFDDRVVILSTFTRNPLRRPLLYHASDLFQAGRRQDLVAIWSAALVEEPHFTRWLQPGRMPAINALTSEYLFRCAPEQ